MTYPSLAIANKVLHSARNQGIALTNMQLIKLVYIAHGWSLALLDKPLVDEAAQAWQHGPVYPSIYREFRDSGWSPIAKTATHPFAGTDWEAEISVAEQSILDKVVEGYGKIHGFALSNRTHQPGTPWHQIWKEGRGKFNSIPNDLIKRHFTELNGATS